MKRFWVLIILCLVLCSGNVEAENVCRHSVTENQVIREPSCRLIGEYGVRCKSYGEILAEGYLAKKPHNFLHCVCTECELYENHDDATKELFLTSDLYDSLGLPLSGDIVIPPSVVIDGKKWTVVGLGTNLFAGNEDITSVEIPDTVRYIAPFCFDGCVNARSIEIPDSVWFIGKAAFQLCSSLEWIDLPDSLEVLEGFAFNHCVSIKNESLEIPKGVRQLGDYVEAPAHMFYDCGSSLKGFTVEEGNKWYKSMDGVLYSCDGSLLVAIPSGMEISDGVFRMPDTVVDMGELAFGTTKGIAVVEISDNLVVNGDLSRDERVTYNNFGNDLSRACYVRGGIRRYITKDSNRIYGSKRGILYTRDGKSLVAVPNLYEGDIDIPEGVERVEKEAFWTSVYKDAEYFKGILYSNIDSISIPDSLVSIPENQITAINKIKELYGTTIEVGSKNPVYGLTGDGYLTLK